MLSVWTLVRALGLAILMCGAVQAAEDPRCQDFRTQYEVPLSTQTIAAFMKDVTYRQFTPEGGNQVEYATADGQVYLWHAGYPRIVAGHWKSSYQTFVLTNPNLTCDTPVLQLCFSYDFGKDDPLSNSWNCVPFARFQTDHLDFTRGDVLKLVEKSQLGQSLPAVLPKYAVSIDGILQGKIQSLPVAK